MYIAIGILFILALIRTMTMLFDPKDDSAKQARTIIVWNAIGILVIIFAKNIIETIFGLEQKVVDANATSL
jgi:predicted membrane protein